ncbi:MAG: hypothetical protein FWD94_03185 [Treponema sp.]|nr:hypothetical protein [Treponema sp.]
MKKFLKGLLITLASLAVLVYGGVFLGHKVFFPIKHSSVPTIEAVTDGTFTFGAQAHANRPANLAEYVELLAAQLRRYNELAPQLWPDNPLIDQMVIAEGIQSGRFWQIMPDGRAEPISKRDALAFGFGRNAYTGGFSFFDGDTDGGTYGGVYLAIDEQNLTNYLMWQQYLHLGTYDAILFLTHEGFHARVQSGWDGPEVIHNRGRNEYADNLPARAARALLQEQLLEAVIRRGEKAPILDALATYADWKQTFPEDFANALYFDRIEGTAYYYELVTGLLAGYPEQVGPENLPEALALLASRPDIYVQHGLISESYTVGAFSAVLLDDLRPDWKEKLAADGNASPAEMLLAHFAAESLPEPRQITQAEIEAVAESLRRPAENRGKPLVFKFLFDILF